MENQIINQFLKRNKINKKTQQSIHLSPITYLYIYYNFYVLASVVYPTPFSIYTSSYSSYSTLDQVIFKKTILFIVMFLVSLCIILKENHRDRTSCIKIFKYFCNTNLVFRRKVMNIRNGHVYSGIYYQKQKNYTSTNCLVYYKI